MVKQKRKNGDTRPRSGGKPSDAQIGVCLDLLPDAVVMMDAGRRIRYLNQAAVELAGRPKEECLGASFDGLFDGAGEISTGCPCGGSIHIVRRDPDVARLCAELVRLREGRAEDRIAADHFTGAARQLAGHINAALDAGQAPARELRGLLDNLSVGHIDGTVLQTVRQEIARVAEGFRSGRFTERGDTDRLPGSYAAMVRDVNAIAETALAPLQQANDLTSLVLAIENEMARLAETFKAGRFSERARPEQFQGAAATAVQNVNTAVDSALTRVAETNRAVEGLRDEVCRLAATVESGSVHGRADLERFSGPQREICAAWNGVLDVLADAIGRIASNAAALTSSAEGLTSSSRQMAGTAEQTASQANVVSAASEQVSKNVSVVATASEQMQVSIREIARSANESARVARNAVTVAESTNQTITRLGESSLEIGKVIKVITSIAQQTNLLALNATIEAARAGEAGKGFAVVANEVKELAKETARATEDIGQKIETIQANTKAAIAAIDEIGSIIAQVNDISNNIASAVEEQTVTTNEIGRNVSEAAKGAGEIARNIAGVAMAAQDTTRGARHTETAAQSLSAMAVQLQALVSKFSI